MKTKIAAILGAVVIVVLGCTIVSKAGIIGVSEGNLEQDARKVQEINTSWEVSQDVNDAMCAMLFYDKASKNCSYSVYLKKDEMSVGYFLHDSGESPYIQEGVQGIIYEDRGVALMSLNEDGVAKIVAEGETDSKTIQVNPEEPFAVVLPLESNVITLYDTQGNVVTLYDTFKG